MREPEQRTIDGVGYTVTQLPATTAVVVQAKLLALGGGAIVRALADPKIRANLRGSWRLVIDELLQSLGERPAELPRLIVDLLVGARCSSIYGGPPGTLERNDIDQHFRGRLLHLYKVLAFALEVNYRDFFDEVLSLLPKGEDLVEEDPTKA